ncbi:MAG TPA: 3-dehydro-L-gulonate 2-dehydrogenase [Clostridiales bacterium]|nr:3-dehydro-L-gulonate 2-dehydrogenase [Clostridiales bacterium]
MRVTYEQMFQEFNRVLLKNGFSMEKAQVCARIFTENSRDGVYSHGLNSFPSFIQSLQKGTIDISSQPVKVEAFGAMERWDAKYGPGMINATFAMNRAVELAKENGIGCVALKNSNHWMRGATYGWQAADSGCVGLCWTTALPAIPPWGGKEAKLGNNPIVFSIPREGGHVVLDIAISQFSYGKMRTYQLNNEMLPMNGGYDTEGNLTNDPGKILESRLALPIGYWKGAGLALVIDLISMVLSGGRCVSELGKQETEHGISQVFTAFDLSRLPGHSEMSERINQVLDDFHDTELLDGFDRVRYPGEGTSHMRKENMEKGIPVVESIWNQVLAL